MTWLLIRATVWEHFGALWERFGAKMSDISTYATYCGSAPGNHPVGTTGPHGRSQEGDRYKSEGDNILLLRTMHVIWVANNSGSLKGSFLNTLQTQPTTRISHTLGNAPRFGQRDARRTGAWISMQYQGPSTNAALDTLPAQNRLSSAEEHLKQIEDNYMKERGLHMVLGPMTRADAAEACVCTEEELTTGAMGG